jgi:predicted RNA binding protein YcfA (HicA-like mRNA interferase family)
MASIKKIIQKMKNQPNGIVFSEAERVLEAHGYRFIRRKSSHCSFRNESGDTITIVDRKDTRTKPMLSKYSTALGKPDRGKP